jgi:hypothetical protein
LILFLILLTCIWFIYKYSLKQHLHSGNVNLNLWSFYDKFMKRGQRKARDM